ncbi:MAG TPA: hypothetical protein ENK28_02535 [Aliiroseovarius sp.]|nr:hypothetical protein [Aliiroseovarius sp.]
MSAHSMRFLAAFAVFLGVTAGPASAERRLNVINNTGMDIVQLFGSNKEATGWGDDLLVTENLESGTNLEVNFDDGSDLCVFDFKAVFSDGNELTQFDTDICELKDLVLE